MKTTWTGWSSFASAMLAVSVQALLVLAISTTALGNVVLNEVEVNPPESGNEWAELHNAGNTSVDVSGWSVTISDQGWVGRIRIPAGTVIPAGRFYVADGNPSWTHGKGGSAELFDSSGEKVDGTPYLEDSFGNDFTWGRHPDGHNTNTAGDWGWSRATKGRPNEI